MRDDTESGGLRGYLDVFRYSRRAVALVWSTSPRLSVLLGGLSLVAGLIPAAVAYVGKLIVDAVVTAAASGAAADREQALTWVIVELCLVALLAAAQRGLSTCRSLLRAQLGHRVNVMILEKAVTLELTDFEDSAFYDRMTRARREASSRPLSLVMRTFELVQNAISLFAYGGLLLSFSPWVALVLVVAAIPAFLVETRFSKDAFRLFRWRSPETRKQMYLETVLAREDYAKEVKLYGLGPLLLDRYRSIFAVLYAEDRRLTLRRGLWGFVLGLLSTVAFYGAYAWIALAAIAKTISLGDMTMYLLVFKQGQSGLAAILASIGGMYEDNLYLSNLYEYLEHTPGHARDGGATEGPRPGDGVRFEGVAFRYPGAERDALRGIDLHIAPGQRLGIVGQNGAGKTTLIKLLTRLYAPTEGRITLDGLELNAWSLPALHRRIGVIFQDFVRYQMLVGENIGAGDVEAFEDEARWRDAAEQGLAHPFIEQLPRGYQTQLGRWFKDGQELSGGQWQKVALSRAFMREADILVLDEPTAAMDAQAELQAFHHVEQQAVDKMIILISHRFSTLRMADHIVVLEDGAMLEEGDHESLMAAGGRYAALFDAQAAAYR